MTARELADKLCKDVVRGVHERDGRSFIVTTFPYPTGDFITLYVRAGPDGTYASDEGMTTYWLAVDGIDLTDIRSDVVRSACLLHEVTFDGESFSRRLGPDSVGADVLSLLQAIARVSTLRYDKAGRSVGTLTAELSTLVDAQIAPSRPYTSGWTDEAYDPTRSHPVDYHFNGLGFPTLQEPNVPSNIFIAGSRERAETVAGIILFWQRSLPNFKSMCVLPSDLKLTRLGRARLASAADAVVSGVGGHERQIANFALSREKFTPSLLIEPSADQGAAARPEPVR